MRKFMLTGAALLAFVPGLYSQPTSPPAREYQLLDGSHFQDECLICGRPTIQQPLRGTFDLMVSGQGQSGTLYVITNIQFQTRSGPSTIITGSGTLEVGGDPRPQTQRAVLDLKVNDQQKLFTNDVAELTRTFPMMDVHLVQTQMDLVQYFSVRIAAAPVRDLWFTTPLAFFSTNLNSRVFPGDLLSLDGRLLRRNSRTVSAFGFAPSPDGYPIQAAALAPGAEIHFSPAQDIFSETRGEIYRSGDLLSDRGLVLLSNEALLANFQPQPSGVNYGLDALQVAPGGELLFSVSSNFVCERIGQISSGDLLSYRPMAGGGTNRLHATIQQLIAGFTPIPAGEDPGLDAIYAWPGGEIWFSTERDFNGQSLGRVSHGDLLSNGGYIVFRSADLLWHFAPSEATANAGLNGVHVVTDEVVVPGLPEFTRTGTAPGGGVELQYSGAGRAFQVERGDSVWGPFFPAGPITPDLSFTDFGAPTNSRSFFRARQW